jgi:hypothetical protein
MNAQRWQDYVIGFVGLCVFSTPWIIPLVSHQSVLDPIIAYVHYSLGLLLVMFSALSVFDGQRWEEIITAGIGLCLMISPWFFKFDGPIPLAGSTLIAGAIVVFLSGLVLFRDRYPMHRL